MEKTLSVDEAFESFSSLKSEFDKFIQEDINESDTRSKLIDGVLFKILGWNEFDVYREGKVDSGYFDYKLSISGFHFIIEAKRNFKEFVIPRNHKTLKVKSFLKENENVINQIRNYAGDFGVNYGVITNGKQYIILKLYNSDGTSWKENPCIVFNGIEDIENRFVEFYETLSKFSIINNGGFIYDLPSNLNPSHTLFSKITQKEKELIRNPLSSKITPIINSVFGEMFSSETESNEDFIQKCFVENRETKKNRDDIERLFSDVAPKLSKVIPAINTKNIQKQISEEINTDDVSSSNLTPPKPIVIIGSKGAGKSTFINHLFKFQTKESDLSNHLTTYLDLRDYFNTNNHFNANLICKKILENIYEKYEHIDLHSLKTLKRIYLKDTKRNDKGIWLFDKENNEASYQQKLADFLTERQSNHISHLENISKYFIGDKRKRLIVIIDNADQFKDDVQEQAFLFAHSLAKTSLCGTVISLREGYYYKWRFSPPFDAYESNVYHITAPKYSEVLQKRLDYTLENLNVDDIEIEGQNAIGYKVKINNQAVIEFLASLKSSVFSSDNNNIIDFLNQTTYPNIREGLRIFKLFLTSGHTKVEDYIMRERFRIDDETHSPIPFHEFIKSIGLINKHYYNSKNSAIHNILSINENSTDHFLNFYILRELVKLYENEGNANRFISIDNIYDLFSSFGYSIKTLRSAILELINISLIDTDEVLTDIDKKDIPDELNITITLKGYYYIKELCTRFHYYDLIIQDTPIFNKDSFNEIYSKFPLSNDEGKRSLNGRVECVKSFMKYIEMCEEKQSNRLKSYFGSFKEYIEPNLTKDINRIERN
jgi:energy-coupling factor transporter ATP-binding protein EcfA2